ncbi:MAG: hypothetical protein WCO51_03835 [bacterium]
MKGSKAPLIIILVVVVIGLAALIIYIKNSSSDQVASTPTTVPSGAPGSPMGSPPGTPGFQPTPGLGGQSSATPSTPTMSKPKETKGPVIAVVNKPIYPSRPDPFSKLASEVYRSKAKIIDIVSFAPVFVPGPMPIMPPPQPVYDPQPYRRLAGILAGSSIAAILETEGQDPVVIRPGTIIGEWRVAQLTSTFAVLKREGNVTPKEVIARLEAPPAGMRQAANQPVGGPGMGPGFGQPGYGVPGGAGRPPGSGGGRPGRGSN